MFASSSTDSFIAPGCASLLGDGEAGWSSGQLGSLAETKPGEIDAWLLMCTLGFLVYGFVGLFDCGLFWAFLLLFCFVF